MTQYDSLAGRIDDIEQAIQFYRDNVEIPSFFRSLGKVGGMRVLDVGCGDGFYARLVARRGADRVVGTDSSGEMIRLAEAAETERPLGIQYHVHDVATMPALGSFDLVTAVNVLHYADSRAALDGMFGRISGNLVTGGRLLAYVGNADTDTETARHYGFFVDRPAGLGEGDPFTVSIGANRLASVRVHYWPAETLARSAASAGFTRVTWEEMIHAPVSADDSALLDRLLKNPPGLLLSAYKE